MPYISQTNLAAAIRKVSTLDLKAKEAVCDEIFASQPILLSSVLALTRLQIEGRFLDALLDLLMAVHLAVKSGGYKLARISVDEHAEEIERFVATVKFSEGMDQSLLEASIKQWDGFVKEPFLTAHATGSRRWKYATAQALSNLVRKWGACTGEASTD